MLKTVKYNVSVFITKKIKKDYPELSLVYDKIISCQSCNKRRPDVFIDLFHYCIIIEIDENQHINYSCENKRTMEIFEALGNRPLVFIRFNPDKYINVNKTIPSIFKFSKTGVIKATKQFYTRYSELKKVFNYWLNHKPTKLIEVVHLFYNVS
jgi:hypothetical protein